MKKIIGLVTMIILSFVLSSMVLCLLKHSNPYLLDLDESALEYDNVDYENLYQVSYDDITQIVYEQMVTDDTDYTIKNRIISDEQAGHFFVGQYLECFELEKKQSVRIIAKEKTDNGVKLEYMMIAPFDIEYQMDSQYINKVTGKSEFKIFVDGEELPATIVKIGPDINENDKFMLKILIDDHKAITHPGTKIDLQLTIEKKENVLCLPMDCIFKDNLGQDFVMISANDTIEIRNVILGIDDGRMVEVLDGLSDGDVVVEKD